MDHPLITLIAFMALTSFILFWLYLRRMLKHLDPSQAVPPHVRAALDTLAEGLMVLDLKENIVLANQAFASIVGRTTDDLAAGQAGEFEWLGPEGDPLAPSDYPWTKALTEGTTQRDDVGAAAGFDGAAGPPIVSRLASGGLRIQSTIATFIIGLDDKLDEMEKCWQQRDFEGLAALAHWLKGSGDTVGYDAFTEPAKTLEVQAKANSEDGVAEALAALREISRRLVVPDDSELAASA